MRSKSLFIAVVTIYWLPVALCATHDREFVDYIYNKYEGWNDPERPLPFLAFNKLMTDVGLDGGNNDTWTSDSDRNLTLYRRSLILQATGYYDNITEVTDLQ